MDARWLIDQVAWLAGLGEPARDGLAAGAVAQQWPRGTVVCRQDDEDRACYVLGEGGMRVSRGLPDGRDVTLAHLDPPVAFGELALLGVGRRSATVTARHDSAGIRLEADAVLQALGAEPAAALSVATDLAARLATANERILRFTLGTAAGAVSATLLGWIQARRDHARLDRDVEVVGGIGDIARTAGIPKRAVMRFMSHLELEGTVTARGGRTIIHDPDALARYLT